MMMSERDLGRPKGMRMCSCCRMKWRGERGEARTIEKRAWKKEVDTQR